MDPNLEARIGDLERKLDAIYSSVEKTRKYFMWTVITSIALFILPVIAIAFVVPSFLSNYVGTINSLSQ